MRGPGVCGESRKRATRASRRNPPSAWLSLNEESCEGMFFARDVLHGFRVPASV